jgi:hypothetical protein
LPNVVDAFKREVLQMLIERSLDADRTVSVVAQRGALEFLPVDNGPELTAHALQG